MASVAEGKLEGPQVDRLLASCWDELGDSGEGGMQGNKLAGRMESVYWAPPILSFVIERHGGAACGSTRGELQYWEVDLDQKTARLVRSGRRQLKPMAKRLPIQSIAEEIVGKLLAGTDDPRIKRLEDGTVKVIASAVVPSGSGFKRTVEGRRKRLVEGVAVGLKPHGWAKATGGKLIREE